MASSEPSPQHVPPPVALHRLMTGHWIAQAIFVAAQLGVADYLRDGPQHTDALARSVGAHPGALYRLLRALWWFPLATPRLSASGSTWTCWCVSAAGSGLRQSIRRSWRWRVSD